MTETNALPEPEDLEDPFPEGEFTIHPLMDSLVPEQHFPIGSIVAAIIGALIFVGGIIYLIIASTIHCNISDTTCELNKAFNTGGSGFVLFVGGVFLATAWWGWAKWKNRVNK